MSHPLGEMFLNFQQYIDEEQDLREEIRVLVRDLEQSSREIMTCLQTIHQPEGIKKIPELCEKSHQLFQNVKTQYAALELKVPKDQYYRFNDHWKYTTQRLVFLAALMVFLEHNRLILRDEAAKTLGIKVNREEGFHLDLDDYLSGLLLLADELSRFAVNSVTSGDYNRPVQIARFVIELNNGFRLLNLKNDSLRKRFDALKYNLKKVEEVVYDLTIRGLKPSPDQETSEEKLP